MSISFLEVWKNTWLGTGCWPKLKAGRTIASNPWDVQVSILGSKVLAVCSVASVWRHWIQSQWGCGTICASEMGRTFGSWLNTDGALVSAAAVPHQSWRLSHWPTEFCFSYQLSRSSQGFLIFNYFKKIPFYNETKNTHIETSTVNPNTHITEIKPL